MKNVLLFCGCLALSGCSYDGSTNIRSGGSILDPGNQYIPTINYRVNQEGIRYHSSLNLLTELKTFKASNIPSSWPETSLPWLEKAFRFVHHQELDGSIVQVKQSQEGSLEKLLFILAEGETFKLLLNNEVTYLTFIDEDNRSHVMKKLTNGEWSVAIDDEELRWNPKAKTLCYDEVCINL